MLAGVTGRKENKMSIASELPTKCQECAKSAGSFIHTKCNLCRKLEFDESVLCDLNRRIQDQVSFTCHAFQPILRLAGSSENNGSNVSTDSKMPVHRKPFLKLLRSDKIRYERALALQKLVRDPDAVFMELKYHFAWNVIHRRPLFRPRNNYFDLVHDTFLRCNGLVGGFASLLWLAPDHVHVYVESDGEKSVETIIQELKQFSGDAIAAEFLGIAEGGAAGIEIWDEAYFSETVG